MDNPAIVIAGGYLEPTEQTGARFLAGASVLQSIQGSVCSNPFFVSASASVQPNVFSDFDAL
jgi:hypothetical protein